MAAHTAAAHRVATSAQSVRGELEHSESLRKVLPPLAKAVEREKPLLGLLRHWRDYLERRDGLKVTRSQLVARLEVETGLLRGLRTLLLALVTFTIVACMGFFRNKQCKGTLGVRCMI